MCFLLAQEQTNSFYFPVETFHPNRSHHNTGIVSCDTNLQISEILSLNYFDWQLVHCAGVWLTGYWYIMTTCLYLLCICIYICIYVCICILILIDNLSIVRTWDAYDWQVTGALWQTACLPLLSVHQQLPRHGTRGFVQNCAHLWI